MLYIHRETYACYTYLTSGLVLPVHHFAGQEIWTREDDPTPAEDLRKSDRELAVRLADDRQRDHPLFGNRVAKEFQDWRPEEPNFGDNQHAEPELQGVFEFREVQEGTGNGEAEVGSMPHGAILEGERV